MFNVFVVCFRRIKLLTPVSLAVENVGRDDKGSYQCLITSKKNSAQAIAELKLGGKYRTQYYLYFYYFCKLYLLSENVRKISRNKR